MAQPAPPRSLPLGPDLGFETGDLNRAKAHKFRVSVVVLREKIDTRTGATMDILTLFMERMRECLIRRSGINPLRSGCRLVF
jgi:hypothetical protein